MEHKQTVTEVKESRLSVKQKVLFGMGDYLNTITYGMISAFLMAFLTDTLLIPMAAVTAIMSLSKLWDAINDPVIGVIIDKSRSPKGVYRPWLIRMMVPFALSNILLWLPIGHWSTSAKITVVSIVYCLYMVFFTAYHIAYGSLGGAMTQNTDDRGSLYGYRLGTSQLLFWLMTVLWLPLINLLMSGGMAQDKAYFTAAIIFTVPGLLFAVLLYRNSREVVEPQKSTKLPAKDLWHFVIQNGPLLMVMFGQFVCGIYMYGRSGVMMYYFTYYAGNTNLFTIYNLIAWLRYRRPVHGPDPHGEVRQQGPDRRSGRNRLRRAVCRDELHQRRYQSPAVLHLRRCQRLLQRSDHGCGLRLHARYHRGRPV